MPEDKMVEWHHRLNGPAFEQTPGDRDREAWCVAVYGSQRVKHSLATKHSFRYVYKKRTN